MALTSFEFIHRSGCGFSVCKEKENVKISRLIEGRLRHRIPTFLLREIVYKSNEISIFRKTFKEIVNGQLNGRWVFLRYLILKLITAFR